MFQVIAFQVAEHIDIKAFKTGYTALPDYNSTSEIFYKTDKTGEDEQEKYLYVLAYGVVVFTGYDEIEMSRTLQYISSCWINPLKERLREEINIHHKSSGDHFGFNDIYLTRIDDEVLRIIMLIVAQSVALDFFSAQVGNLLLETKEYIVELEKRGRLRISSRALMKFIGKTLNMKNRIIENLYILNSPDETWDDEYLNRIDTILNNTFDITPRFRSIDYQIQMIKENLELFKDVIQHRRSNLLEIIIILLILIEVISLFI